MLNHHCDKLFIPKKYPQLQIKHPDNKINTPKEIVVFNKEVIELFVILIHVILQQIITIQQQKLLNFQIHIKIILHNQVQELLKQKQNLLKIVKMFIHQKKI